MTTSANFQSVILDDGTIIQVQMTTLGGPVKVAANKGGLPFEGITKSVETISRSLMKAIRKASPNKATIQFGIEIGTKEGQLTALLVQGTTTANLSITLEWVKETEKKPTKKTANRR